MCLATEKKIIRPIKKQKTQSEETEKASESTTVGMLEFSGQE